MSALDKKEFPPLIFANDLLIRFCIHRLHYTITNTPSHEQIFRSLQWAYQAVTVSIFFPKSKFVIYPGV